MTAQPGVRGPRPGPGNAAGRAGVGAGRGAVGGGAVGGGAVGGGAVGRGDRTDPADEIGPRPALVVIGPPGSGKSAVGAAIARMTGLPLRDTDSDIERQAGKSIPEIFFEDGEPVFRSLERAAVAAGLAEHRGVLALGGGAILADETRARLAGHQVIFLSLSMPTGIRRTGLAVNRPLLTGVNPRATYKALLEARIPLYREIARHEVETDHLSVTEVARIIIEKLELRP